MGNAKIYFLTFSACMTSGSGAAAYERLEVDWTHQQNPMSRYFVICAQGAPSGAVQAIKNAATKWNYTKFKITFAAERCLGGGPSRNDNVNYINFGPPMNPTYSGLSEYRNQPETKRLQECDICFSSSRDWYTGTASPSVSQNDVSSIALREFRYCLGLDDSKEKNKAMSEQLDKGKFLRNLSEDDRNSRNTIYGRP